MEPTKDKLTLTLERMGLYLVYAYLLYIVAALGHKAYGSDVNPDTLCSETTTNETNVHSLFPPKRDLLHFSSATSDYKQAGVEGLRSFPCLMSRDPHSFEVDVVKRSLKERMSMSEAGSGLGKEQFFYPNTSKLQPEPVPLIILSIDF